MAIKTIKKKTVLPKKTNAGLCDVLLCSNYQENDVLITDSFFNDEDTYTIKYYDINGVSTAIEFEISQIPHCCSIYELGKLIVNDKFPQKGFNKLINILLTPGTTYIVNTNGKNSSVRWEQLLAKNKYFTCVKQYISQETKNTISMWVSNNE